MNGDIYDSGIPKYSSAQDIYDALCELVHTEEMNILSEIGVDVSYEQQTYYYTDKGYKLKEKFEELSDYGNRMWLLDLAIYQIDNNLRDIHYLVFDALNNTDLAKRLNFKKLFIDKLLRGNKLHYIEIVEKFYDELHELNRFDHYETVKVLYKATQIYSLYSNINEIPYRDFCHELHKRVENLKLREEVQFVIECRELLTAYDDFIFGLRANQALYEAQEQRFNQKLAELQSSYKAMVANILMIAERQGVDLSGLAIEATKPMELSDTATAYIEVENTVR